MANVKPTPKYLTKALRCPDGTRKYIRGKTQAELDRKVREAQAQLGMGININDNTTVNEFAQIWIDVYKRPSVQPQTLESILSILNNHIIPAIGHKRIMDVRPADCAYLMSRLTRQGLSKGTQDNVRIRLKEMFECARDNALTAMNPVTRSVRSAGQSAKERTALSTDQVSALYRAAQADKESSLITFVLLCSCAGLRTSEALGLNLANVDLNNGTISVVEQFAGGGGTTTQLKTSVSSRVIPMPPILYAHMSMLKKDRSGYVFDVRNPNLRSFYTERLIRLSKVRSNGDARAKKSKAPLDFYVHPHLLRHTFCTRCIEAGMDIKQVQYLMGHASPNITLGVYTHYQEESRRAETADQISAAFSDIRLAVAQ